jgi:hypothetical protein
MDDRAVLDGTTRKIATDFRGHVRELEFLINQQDEEFRKINEIEKQKYNNSNSTNLPNSQNQRNNFLVN